MNHLEKRLALCLASSIALSSANLGVFAESQAYEQDLEQIYKEYQANNYFDEFFDSFFYSKKREIQEKSSIYIQKAKSDESEGKKGFACANYLKAALGPFSKGDFENGRLYLDKAVAIAVAENKQFQNIFAKAMLASVPESNNFADRNGRTLINDYWYTTILKVKESGNAEDDTYLQALNTLVGVRTEQNKFASASELCKKRIALLEKLHKTSDQAYVQSLCTLYTLSKRAGNQADIDSTEAKLSAEIKNKMSTKAVDDLANLALMISKMQEQKDQLLPKFIDLTESLAATADRSETRKCLAALDLLQSDSPNYLLQAQMGIPLNYLQQGDHMAAAVRERLLKLSYKLSVSINGPGRESEPRLIILANYLAKNGKSNEAADLYKSALKFYPETGPNSALRNQLNMAYVRMLKESSSGTSTEQAQVLAEIQRHENEMKLEQANRLKDLAIQAEKKLADARTKAESDPESFVLALLAMARYRSGDNKREEMCRDLKEAMLAFDRVQATDSDESILGQFWGMAGSLCVKPFTKQDEKMLYEITDLMIKRIALHKTDFADSFELTEPADYLSRFQANTSAIEYLNHLAEQIKKNLPKNIRLLTAVYESMANVYADSEQEAKEIEVLKLELRLIEGKTGTRDKEIESLKRRIESLEKAVSKEKVFEPTPALKKKTLPQIAVQALRQLNIFITL